MKKLNYINKSEFFNYENGDYRISGNKTSRFEPETMTGICGGTLTKGDMLYTNFTVDIVEDVPYIVFGDRLPMDEMAAAIDIVSTLVEELKGE